MAHWTGTRSGWNRRGNQAELERREQAREQALDLRVQQANPNSRYWQTRARGLQQELADFLGTEDYRLWAELTWPGASIDTQTWREIFETTQGAWNVKEQLNLECSCNGVTTPLCPVCRAFGRLHEYDDNQIVAPELPA